MDAVTRSMENSSNTWGISVVIPNYNGRRLLEENLPYTIAALKFTEIPYEVIIADDASADDSIAFLNEAYPDIKVIKGQVNMGFSVNMNRGITAASFDLILLLNSDIKLTGDYFKTQLRYFDLTDTFGVMGKILDDAAGHLQEACKYPRDAFFKVNYFKDLNIYAPDAYTYYISGANALVNRQKLLELGGFNEIFSPYYHEDLDLSLRAWESGWKCYYDANAICRHAVSTTIKAHSTVQTIKVISTRNKLLLHYFHLTGPRLFLWQVVNLLSLLIRWINGKFYYYKAYRQYLTKLPAMIVYKQQFVIAAKAKGRYIPFITVKQEIKKALDIIK